MHLRCNSDTPTPQLFVRTYPPRSSSTRPIPAQPCTSRPRIPRTLCRLDRAPLRCTCSQTGTPSELASSSSPDTRCSLPVRSQTTCLQDTTSTPRHLSRPRQSTILRHTPSTRSACCCRRSSPDCTRYTRHMPATAESPHCTRSRRCECSRPAKTNHWDMLNTRRGSPTFENPHCTYSG
jgi:hypothetical protein